MGIAIATSPLTKFQRASGERAPAQTPASQSRSAEPTAIPPDAFERVGSRMQSVDKMMNELGSKRPDSRGGTDLMSCLDATTKLGPGRAEGPTMPTFDRNRGASPNLGLVDARLSKCHSSESDSATTLEKVAEGAADGAENGLTWATIVEKVAPLFKRGTKVAGGKGKILSGLLIAGGAAAGAIYEYLSSDNDSDDSEGKKSEDTNSANTNCTKTDTATETEEDRQTSSCEKSEQEAQTPAPAQNAASTPNPEDEENHGDSWNDPLMDGVMAKFPGGYSVERDPLAIAPIDDNLRNADPQKSTGSTAPSMQDGLAPQIITTGGSGDQDGGTVIGGPDITGGIQTPDILDTLPDPGGDEEDTDTTPTGTDPN